MRHIVGEWQVEALASWADPVSRSPYWYELLKPLNDVERREGAHCPHGVLEAWRCRTWSTLTCENTCSVPQGAHPSEQLRPVFRDFLQKSPRPTYIHHCGQPRVNSIYSCLEGALLPRSLLSMLKGQICSLKSRVHLALWEIRTPGWPLTGNLPASAT